MKLSWSVHLVRVSSDS